MRLNRIKLKNYYIKYNYTVKIITIFTFKLILKKNYTKFRTNILELVTKIDKFFKDLRNFVGREKRNKN